MKLYTHDDSPDTLEDGTWVRDPKRHVMVWQPAEPPPPPSALDLIACYSCGAKVTEGCRTKTGASSSPHAGRIAPRLCPCGGALKPRHRLCEWCAARSAKASRIRSQKRIRRTRREAA